MVTSVPQRVVLPRNWVQECHLRRKMRTHKYSEVAGKYRPINIPTYIPEDSPSWKPQSLSKILLSAAMGLLTMSTLVIIQRERAVYGRFFKW